MKLGISLPPAYLAGRDNPDWTPAFGPVRQALETLKDAGVSSVELRTLGSRSDTLEALAALDALRKAGLDATVHGYLDEHAGDCGLPAVPVMRALAAQPRPALFTVHCLSSKDADRSEMAGRTERTLAAWFSHAAAHDWNVALALELNRAKDVADPGSDYDGLLDMRRRPGCERVGFCWDLGHAANNLRRGMLPEAVPGAFARGTVHTHIHGLGEGGETHWPLSVDNPWVPGWVAMLRQTGYDGVLNIELEPRRFAKSVAVREAVLDSIRALRSMTS